MRNEAVASGLDDQGGGRWSILGGPDDARSGRVEDVCTKGNEQAFRQRMQ
jgi:hypothetical protein